MTHEFIAICDAERWALALRDVRHPAAHGRDYCAAIAAFSGLETVLYVATDGLAKLVCPLSIRQKEVGYPDLVSPYGFGGFVASDAFERWTVWHTEWLSFCRNRGFVTAFLLQHPAFRQSADVWGPALQDHREVYINDLTLTVDQIWQRLSKTHRYELRRAELRSSVRLVTDETRVRAALVELYPQTLARVDASQVYRFTSDDLERMARLPGAVLVGAEESGKIEAVALFLHTRTYGEYFLNASSPEGRKYTRELVWFGIKTLKSLGVDLLNLGGGITNGDSLENFKRRFGGEAVRGQAIKEVFDDVRYSYLLGKYGNLTAGTASYFPSYWLPRGEVAASFPRAYENPEHR